VGAYAVTHCSQKLQADVNVAIETAQAHLYSVVVDDVAALKVTLGFPILCLSRVFQSRVFSVATSTIKSNACFLILTLNDLEHT